MKSTPNNEQLCNQLEKVEGINMTLEDIPIY